jgi:membrane protein implicated in regulation of membrane protease activity
MPGNPADARRRWFGVFFLIVAAGMLIWGQTFLRPWLSGLGFVAYWLACLVFTGLAMLTALLDIWAVRRRTRDQHRDLLRHIFKDGERGEEKEGDEPDGRGRL